MQQGVPAVSVTGLGFGCKLQEYWHTSTMLAIFFELWILLPCCLFTAGDHDSVDIHAYE